jgi:hypothetical protein
MASRQRDGVLIRCGRPQCGRELCRALLASAGEDPVVVLGERRYPARLASAEPERGAVRRVLLTCNGRVTADGKTRRCGWQQTLRLDQGRLVDAVVRLDGRGELVLGVDV